MPFMLPHHYRVQVATTPAQLRDAYRLRIDVFGEEFGYGRENEIDQFVSGADPGSIQLPVRSCSNASPMQL